jgi:hypothetical protein
LKLETVAAYSQFLGCRVTVRYRVGEILLTASGTFSADSGRSIFLEQHVEQRGVRKYFRWEIPYPYIYRIEAAAELEREGGEKSRDLQDQDVPKAAAAAAGESPSGASSVLPFPQRSKTA